MRDEDFDQVMDSWSAHETETAPDMQPTASMYRMVRAREKKRLTMPSWGWAAAGVALAGLLALVFLYTLVLPGQPSNQQVAAIGLREGFGSDRDISTKGTEGPPEKGSEKGPARGHTKGPPSFQQLEFQVQRPDTQFVEGIDLGEPQPETISITSADNYGLVLQPAADSYVTIYQVSPSGILTQLLPNSAYSSVQDPLRQDQTYYLPEEPNWFYLDDRAGQVYLTILASAQPLQELQDQFRQYSQANDGAHKEELLVEFLNQLDTIIETHPEEASRWVFVFDHQ